eukprot:3681299-Pleurochrysis_carterae.AAC.1
MPPATLPPLPPPEGAAEDAAAAYEQASAAWHAAQAEAVRRAASAAIAALAEHADIFDEVPYERFLLDDTMPHAVARLEYYLQPRDAIESRAKGTPHTRATRALALAGAECLRESVSELAPDELGTAAAE